jgi:glycosyltransferase involved in cell wall biosynthesis
MFENHRVAVVVPAFREARILPRMLARIPNYVDAVFVVDDGSPDDTYAVAAACAARDPRVQVLRLVPNQGVGAAIARGYQAALDAGAEVIAVMAADDQMDPADLPAVLRPITSGQADYTKGDRLAHPERRNMPPLRRFGTAALARLTALVTGYHELRDTQCGYTAIHRDTLRRLDLPALYPRYGYPNDMLIHLSMIGARLAQPTVRPVYADESSGLRISRVILPISGILARGALRRLRR